MSKEIQATTSLSVIICVWLVITAFPLKAGYYIHRAGNDRQAGRFASSDESFRATRASARAACQENGPSFDVLRPLASRFVCEITLPSF